MLIIPMIHESHDVRTEVYVSKYWQPEAGFSPYHVCVGVPIIRPSVSSGWIPVYDAPLTLTLLVVITRLLVLRVV